MDKWCKAMREKGNLSTMSVDKLWISKWSSGPMKLSTGYPQVIHRLSTELSTFCDEFKIGKLGLEEET